MRRMPGQQSTRRPPGLRMRSLLSSILYPLSSFLLLLSGCDRDDKFQMDMYDQPRQDTYDRSPFFSDGSSARPLVPGTVARPEAYVDRMSQPGGGVGNLAGKPFPADFPT